LQGTVAWRLRELFTEIAQAYDITIEEIEVSVDEVSVDHVHIFCSFPPCLSISQVITRFKSLSKSLSTRAIFKEHPQVKKQLWGGQFWQNSHLPRTVGDNVTAEVIKNYIRHHREEKYHAQLDLFASCRCR
jgi:putative transposase